MKLNPVLLCIETSNEICSVVLACGEEIISIRESDEKNSTIHCTVTTENIGQTGVEIEALTGVQIGLLTIYDMCKAVDRGMVIKEVKLLEKSGGKSGTWKAE